MFLLVISEILEWFHNTVVADNKFSFGTEENLPQPIQSILSKKQKAFSQFFVSFLKCTSNFEHFEKKRCPS